MTSLNSDKQIPFDDNDTRNYLSILPVSPENVVEMRVVNTKHSGTVSGYYSDPEALARDAANWSGKAPGVYVTLNPVNPALLARSKNKAAVRTRLSSKDEDIIRRNWILIDFDADRPAGISSTDGEHEEAITTARACKQWLTTHMGFNPASIVLGDSGNGGHLLIRVQLPNDEESKRLIQRVLQSVDVMFGSERIKVDQTVHNAARISKVYGTWVAKGDNTEERPHRMAKLLEFSTHPTVAAPELLHRLAGIAPEEDEEAQSFEEWDAQHGRKFDIEGWIKKHGLTVVQQRPWDKTGAIYKLEECPFNPDHKDGDANIFVFASGKLGFKCHHNSCSGNDWHALRDLLEPGWRQGLDPEAENKRIALKTTVETAIQQFTDGDKEAFTEPSIIGALALLQADHPAEFAYYKSQIKQLKYPLQDLNRAIKQHQNKHLRLVTPNESVEQRTAGSMLSNIPDGLENLVVPDSYELVDGHPGKTVKRTFKPNVGTQIAPIALAPVLVTGLLKDIDFGREALRMSWKRGHRWQHATVDRDVAANARSIVALAGEGFPVTSGSAGELTTYLSLFEAANLSKLPMAQVSGRLGWQGKNGELGFLLGKTLIRPSGDESAELDFDTMPVGDWQDDMVAFRAISSGDEQIANGFHSRGTLEGWLDTVKLAAPYKRAKVALYTAFVPPILNIIGCSNFIVDFANRTSTGKSTVQRIAASVAGNPDEHSPDTVFGTWDATKVWIERASVVLNGLPLILDDTKRAKNKKIVADMLYTVASGRGRGRGNIKSISTTGTWRTVMISSGEAPATSFTSDGGTRGRVLEIKGNPFESNSDETRRLVQRINSSLMMNYGHAMPLFLRWVMDHKDDWDKWAKKYGELIDQYASSVVGSVAGRLATYAAAVTITSYIVHQAFKENGTPLPWKCEEDPLQDLWQDIVTEAEDPVGEEEAIRTVVGWASANESNFFGRYANFDSTPLAPRDAWGRWDSSESWKYIAFRQDKLTDFLRSQNFNPDEILRAWKERGWLDVPESQRGYQKQLRVEDGKKIWLVVLKREAIDQLD